jgi:RimJ/RimL family protein N-acetyltransferase
MNLHRLALGVLDYNVRARRCYEKCGFREEGREREHRFHDGRWHDQIFMGILQPEFDRGDR